MANRVPKRDQSGLALRSRAINVPRAPKNRLRDFTLTLLHALRVPSRVVAKL